MVKKILIPAAVGCLIALILSAVVWRENVLPSAIAGALVGAVIGWSPRKKKK